jgi:exosortase/archaeosortase family protein
MLGERAWWENLVILASAIPIALTVNSIRITVTGLLYQLANSEVAEMVFHDLAGWVMMPMALGMMFLLQQILDHLFVTEDNVVAALAPLPQVSEPVSRPAVRPLQAAPPAVFRPRGGDAAVRNAD